MGYFFHPNYHPVKYVAIHLTLDFNIFLTLIFNLNHFRMLRKIILPALLLTVSGASYAQSTLTGSNFNPQVGDAFALKICDTTGITPGPSGAAVTWNFSTGPNALMVTQTDTGRAVACTSTPYFSSFPASTVALKGPTVTASATTYLIANSTKLSQNGYYAAADTNLILSDPADQLQYPFTYLSSFSDPYAGILTLGPIAAHHTGTINVTCDAWGTLQLPGRTDVNVLRVKTTQVFTDSTNLFGSPIVKSYNILSYDWYKSDYHSALLTIQTVTEVGAPNPSFKFIAYAPQQISAVNDIAAAVNDVQISPNPSEGAFNVQFNAIIPQQVRISLHDITGREVAILADKQCSGRQNIHCGTQNLSKGLYFVHINSGGETLTRKLIIQ